MKKPKKTARAETKRHDKNSRRKKKIEKRASGNRDEGQKSFNPYQHFIINCLENTPPLYHLTHDHSIKPLLESKSLLLTPTWDFKDEDEYIHGLRVIAGWLKKIINDQDTFHAVDSLIRPIRGYRPEDGLTREILDRVIDNIEYEIANHRNPKVKTYVGCLTAQPFSETMIGTYGNRIIEMHPLLPVAAHSVRSPFTTTSLSRVTYDQNEFERFLFGTAFSSLYRSSQTASAIKILKALERTRLISTIANRITENLCLFATNLKGPEFIEEHEWRLKASISTYDDTEVLPEYSRKISFQGDELPACRAWQGPREKYHFELLDPFHKFLSNGVMGLEREVGDGAELYQWITDWNHDHCSPRMEDEDVATLIKAFRKAGRRQRQ